jgi:hypothetical protein
MLAVHAAVYAPVITDNPEFETPAPGLDKIASQATPLTGFSVRSPLPGLGLNLSLRRIGSRSTITGSQGVLYMAMSGSMLVLQIALTIRLSQSSHWSMGHQYHLGTSAC